MKQSSEIDWLGVCLAASALSDEVQRALEQVLETDPANLLVRVKLVGCYFSKLDARRIEHIIWLIRNYPHTDLGGMGHFSSAEDPRRFLEASQAWDAAYLNDPTNLAVIRLASAFHAVDRPDISRRYLAIGRALDPRNSYWDEEMAHVLETQAAGNVFAGEQRSAKEEILDARLAALQKVRDPQKTPALAGMALISALDVNDVSLARTIVRTYLPSGYGAESMIVKCAVAQYLCAEHRIADASAVLATIWVERSSPWASAVIRLICLLVDSREVDGVLDWLWSSSNSIPEWKDDRIRNIISTGGGIRLHDELQRTLLTL